MRRAIAIAACCAGLTAAPALAQDAAHARLVGPGGEEMGTVTLAQSRDDGVLVQVEATGLPSGWHGFHIHEVGQCEPDFSAAGDHYNPDGSGHGFLAEGGHHAGDLPNIHADDSGAARADAFTTRVSLKEDAANTVFDSDGSAFIVHERPDSYGEDAGAGGRIACGVIEPGQP